MAVSTQNMLYFFFYHVLYFFYMYFFFLKKFKPHSLTHFKPCIFFFPGTGKKKYSVFTHSHNFVENVPKMIFFKKKKKYGTFGQITPFKQIYCGFIWEELITPIPFYRYDKAFVSKLIGLT